MLDAEIDALVANIVVAPGASRGYLGIPLPIPRLELIAHECSPPSLDHPAAPRPTAVVTPALPSTNNSLVITRIHADDAVFH